MKYSNELQMSKEFESALTKNLPETTKVIPEFKSLVGIPDFILLESREDSEIVISYELKLSNWRRALHQAFRYKTFSNMVYVVIDEASCAPALKNIELFKRYQVGLATFNCDKQLKMYYQPNLDFPFSESTQINIKTKIMNNN